MRILLWSQTADLDAQASPILSAAGHVLFRETDSEGLVPAARREQPFLIVLAPAQPNESLLTAVSTLSTHPDTRWTPILLLVDSSCDREFLKSLLETGASSLIFLDREPELIQARLNALERTGLQVAALRSARITDERTGFYHQSFLLDQLHVFCRKQRRDGVGFCLLFLELRGEESEIDKIAPLLAATVRGADLFGHWEDNLFAILLPASGEEQARLLSLRFERILKAENLRARCGLVASTDCTVESDALTEAALNTLDCAWQQEAPFLWRWLESDGTAVGLFGEPE